MSKRLIPFIPVIILVVLGAGLLAKRRHAVNSAAVATPLSYTIGTTVPRTMTVAQVSTFLAKLEATNSADVSSRLSSRVTSVLVVENQLVQPGDLLIRLDCQEIIAGIAALQAKLVTARKQVTYSESVLARNRELFQVGGLSQELLTTAEIAFSGANADVKEVEQNLAGLRSQVDYCEIRASFAGHIGTVFLGEGDLATPGRPLLTLNSLPQKLTFSFMPTSAAIAPGQVVRLHGIRAGEVTRLYGDAHNGLTVAEVKLDGRHDRANGSYLTIEVVTSTATGCGIPLWAILHREQRTSVMVYKDGHFGEQPVEITAQGNGFAVIEPVVSAPVAVAAETKLSLLPSYGNVRVAAEGQHE